MNTVSSARKLLRELCTSIEGNVHLLDNASVFYKGFRIVGTTLWYAFVRLLPFARACCVLSVFFCPSWPNLEATVDQHGVGHQFQRTIASTLSKLTVTTSMLKVSSPMFHTTHRQIMKTVHRTITTKDVNSWYRENVLWLNSELNEAARLKQFVVVGLFVLGTSEEQASSSVLTFVATSHVGRR